MLTDSERHRLKKMTYGHKTPHQARQRATIVLLAARGRPNARIAMQTRLHVDTVRTWRGRFAAGGLPALADRERSGRPVSFTALQVAEVKTLACQLPVGTGAPLSRWSCPGLARRWSPIAGSFSHSTVRRRLKQDALKPWQYQSWLSVRDPAFRPKAARVERRQRLLPPREEGHRSSDQGVSERCHGPHPRARLLDESGRDLLLHRPAQGRLAQRLHGPQRGRDRLRAFEDHYNGTAQPFQWRFTTSDLDDLLTRLDRHTLDRQEESLRSSHRMINPRRTSSADHLVQTLRSMSGK
ncbi:helix-turn-helix domain-containing protein [Streptomyces decoyicus]|uniref:helix-turn-helix domain-containing protein n=1 Tax=Streptomyces decoyicus TaxID=249567 RepID=UPI00386EC800|nr:helix-turn-helix domain-containing protein [Streptomyces decoyicus]